MVPLCVDLDGTLVRTDTLHESLLGAVRRDPAVVLSVPGWWSRGRAVLKRQLAARSPVDPETLPYRADLLEWLRDEHARGRKLVLATAADRAIAESVAAHAGCFDEVLASDGEANLKGTNKAAELTRRFGAKGFDYVGDSPADLDVWSAARQAITAGASASTLRALAGRGVTVARQFPGPKPFLATLPRALRIHQWSKNLLVFIAIVLAHQAADPARLGAVCAAFLAFGLVASAVYVINDLLDLDNDRAHPVKRLRPFAAGDLPIAAGLVLVPLLLASGFAVAALVSWPLTVLLGAYFAATTLYSFRLKRIPMVDVLTLAFLYTSRVLAGGIAARVKLSPWLLGFSIFLFFSLALVKRVSEMRLVAAPPGQVLRGRGYRAGEDTLLAAMGIASGYLASLVLALYMQSPDVVRLYATPEWLWPACPLVMFWISRVWLLTARGEMPGDPIVFALHDPPSYLLLASLAALIAFAKWMPA